MDNVFKKSPIIVNIVNPASLYTNNIVIDKQFVWINTCDKKTVKLWDDLNYTKLREQYRSSISSIQFLDKKKRSKNSRTIGGDYEDDDDIEEE